MLRALVFLFSGLLTQLMFSVASRVHAKVYLGGKYHVVNCDRSKSKHRSLLVPSSVAHIHCFLLYLLVRRCNMYARVAKKKMCAPCGTVELIHVVPVILALLVALSNCYFRNRDMAAFLD